MRQILDFNENWWFIHADVDVSEARPGEGELVSLPHTWNALDGQREMEHMTEAVTGM